MLFFFPFDFLNINFLHTFGLVLMTINVYLQIWFSVFVTFSSISTLASDQGRAAMNTICTDNVRSEGTMPGIEFRGSIGDDPKPGAINEERHIL